MNYHPPSLQARIADDLRARILDGRVAPGTRVPSSRAYAETQGVSRTTVVLAYEQLLAEGFLEGRRGSGTFVAYDLHRRPRNGTVDAKKPTRIRLSSFGRDLRGEARRWRHTGSYAEPLRWDFRYGRAGLGVFPRTSWRRSVASAGKTEERGSGNYVSALGAPELRRAIAGYLDRARGLNCDPDDICITTGSQQALYLCARLLCDPGDTVLVEEPHYAGARYAFQFAGAVVQPVETDAAGLNTDALPRTAQAVYVTPSHQFPLGGVLPLGRRQTLLSWARRQKVAVIEDDYDGEYRFGTKPVPPLRSMEGAESVLYLGTFSKVLLPTLRIGYAVVPSDIAPVFEAGKELMDLGTPTLGQYVLAGLLESGAYERHIRRSRRRYAERRTTLLEELEANFGDDARPIGSAAGLHLYVEFPGTTWHALDMAISRARDRGVGVYSAAPYYMRLPRNAALVFGFGALEPNEIRDGMRALASVMA